ncbi:MAG: EF-hand domain-containing protein [Betaproteobacteria bacterium]|nr:EF-hand domain-containing protein [Betaproteobacteria bacterium]
MAYLLPVRTALCIGVLLFVGSALGQSPEPAGRLQEKMRLDKRFRAADKDGDGALTREEARRGMPSVYRMFDQVDADKDGKVTREELEAAFQARARREAARLRALDANRDNVLTADEIGRNAASSQRVLGEMDANRDGRITRDELETFIERRYYWDLDRRIAPNVLIRGNF